MNRMDGKAMCKAILKLKFCLFIEILHPLGLCHVWQVNLNLFYIYNSPLAILASIEEIIARRGEWVSGCYAHFGSRAN